MAMTALNAFLYARDAVVNEGGLFALRAGSLNIVNLSFLINRRQSGAPGHQEVCN